MSPLGILCTSAATNITAAGNILSPLILSRFHTFEQWSKHDTQLPFFAKTELHSWTTMSESHIAKDSHITRLPGKGDSKCVICISPLLLLSQSEGFVISEEHLEGALLLWNFLDSWPRVKPLTIVSNGRDHDVPVHEGHIFEGRLVVTSLHDEALSRVVCNPFNHESLLLSHSLRFSWIIGHPGLLPVVVGNAILSVVRVFGSICHSPNEAETLVLELLAKGGLHDMIVGLHTIRDEAPSNPRS
mmetsp:Transcript_9739/g.16200  ORF Transcript_9739/g.16200 Transcript_9739/m.16200 type:complete len:244 (+) Transcript_9739:406-1137(+)